MMFGWVDVPSGHVREEQPVAVALMVSFVVIVPSAPATGAPSPNRITLDRHSPSITLLLVPVFYSIVLDLKIVKWDGARTQHSANDSAVMPREDYHPEEIHA
jgi:hypothetical protein